MRIPFPERVNLPYTLAFATAIFCVQVLEGTHAFFAGCVFCFIMVAAIGFNIAGGIMYPSGAFIGFNAIFTLILPIIVKAILGEAADTNLRTPIRTIEVYLLGMVAMVAAAIVSRRFRARKALISDLLPDHALHSAYVGSAVFACLIFLVLAYYPYGGSGSLASFLVQVNRFPLLTWVLGVIYIIRRSNGQRSMSWPLLGMILYIALGAALSFSKEQFLSPFFAWAVTAALMRYRLHWINFVAFSVGLFFVIFFMVPYAQYGRGIESDLSRVELSAYLLTHMSEVREGYQDSLAGLETVHYYNRSLGLLDRLNVLAVDDALIDITDRTGPFGYRPLREGFINVIPHVFYPNKPIPYFGNVYAHEIGLLAEEDVFTGVSFSPSGDAYHEGLLSGVLIAQPLVFALVFLVLDSVIGDVRLNPVGLLTTVLVSRASTEGMLCNAPSLIAQNLFANVMAAYVCAYVLPMLGSIFNKPFLMRPQAPNLTPGAASSPPATTSPHPVSSL